MTDQTSTGEPTIHPQFCEFLETVYNSGVVPNYTTNGITLAKGDEYTEKLLDSTKKYVGRYICLLYPFHLSVGYEKIMLTEKPKFYIIY